MVCASRLRGVGNADVLGDYCGPSNSDSNAGGLWVTEE